MTFKTCLAAPLALESDAKCGNANPNAVEPFITAKNTVKIVPRSKSEFHAIKRDANLLNYKKIFQIQYQKAMPYEK